MRKPKQNHLRRKIPNLDDDKVLDVVSDNAGVAGVVEHGKGGVHRRTDERRFRPVRRRLALYKG